MDFHSGRLRATQPNDSGIIFTWRNSDRIRKSSHCQNLISEEEHSNWFKTALGDSTRRLMIFEYRDEPAGFVQFFDIDSVKNTCRWGFYLGRDDFPKGTGSLMGAMALDMAFHDLNIDSIFAEVIDTNLHSLRYHEKLGFEFIANQSGYKVYALRKSRWNDQRKLIA